MASCGFAVSYCNAIPIFIDCDDTLCIDPDLIEAKITKKTKAIMYVDIYGRLANEKAILKIAKKHHLKTIHDACEAQGAVFESKADITCYSFYENKIIHAEEGGICTTDNKKYADRINYLKNMAFDKRHTYYHKEIGYNYRMPNSQAKLALESLKDFPNEYKRRRIIEKKYYGENIHDAVWVLDNFAGEGDRQFFKPLSTFPMWKNKNSEKESPKAHFYSKIGTYIRI